MGMSLETERSGSMATVIQLPPVLSFPEFWLQTNKNKSEDNIHLLKFFPFTFDETIQPKQLCIIDTTSS